MKVTKVFMTEVAKILIESNQFCKRAYDEVISSIESPTWPKDSNIFTINNTAKNGNGVVPLKESCYIMLEDTYDWFREKHLDVLKYEKQKGGPIDVYKEFGSGTDIKRVGIEFETGNISSAHRSLNKLLLGLNRKELDLGIIVLPVKELSYFLTDRVSNYEELEPYFENATDKPFIVIGFNADDFGNVKFIPKGPDGMSTRSKKKWKF
jgi:hypothetical protein